MAHRWAEKHNPDLVVQLGDLGDQKAWSRWPKDTDDPNPAQEFDELLVGCEKLWGYFPQMKILKGNHDMRLSRSMQEARLPAKMFKELDEMIDLPGWEFMNDEKLVVPTARGKILFVHGDEDGGTPIEKATHAGMNLVQGHTHKATIVHREVMGNTYFGAEFGHLMDYKSKAAKYAARSFKTHMPCFGVIKHGVPYVIPVDGGRV
jgi:predicted phosphodiesterase